MKVKSAKAPGPVKKAAAPRTARMTQDKRRMLILEQAAEVLAQRGFDISTPELAERLGIAQSLFYKYFENKLGLLKAVYDHVSPSGEFYDEQMRQLQDRSLTLRSRLNRFYLAYAEKLWNYRRARIQMWANLLQPEWNGPFFQGLNNVILPTIARELRSSMGLADDEPITERDLEVARALHGMIYHMAAIRRWIHPDGWGDDNLLVRLDLHVSLFLRGVRELYAVEGNAGPPSGAV